MNRAQKRLTVGHQKLLADLRAKTSTVVLHAWDRLGYYDSPAAARFVPLVTPIVAAAQRQAAIQTRAYVGEYLTIPVTAPDPALLTPSALRNGTPPSEVYQRPFRQVWWRLSQGGDVDEAIAGGRSRLAASVNADIQLAVRASGIAIAQRNPQIQGWARNADEGACDLCTAADGEQLNAGDEWGIHPFCGCTAAPTLAAPDDITSPPGVDVHDHGELGALLVAAGDTFSDR